jgi:hypothetical protein
VATQNWAEFYFANWRIVKQMEIGGWKERERGKKILQFVLCYYTQYTF